MSDKADEVLLGRLQTLSAAAGDDATLSQREMLAAAALCTTAEHQTRLELATKTVKLWRRVRI